MKLYVKDRCPGCDSIKKRLAAAGRIGSVQICNIDQDRAHYDALMSLGARVVPVLVADNGQVYVNFGDVARALGV